MHVANHRARKGLDRARQLDDPVAVRSAHPLVEPLEHSGGGCAGVHLRVVEVVCVHHSNHQLEAVPPVGARVVPVEVLRLLEDGDVPLLGRHQSREVDLAALDDAADPRLVVCGVPAYAQRRRWLDVCPVREPPPRVRLLLRRLVEGEAAREEQQLVLLWQPRHVERHRVALGREVGGPQERVDRRAGHPRQRRRGQDSQPPPAGAQVRVWRRPEHVALCRGEPHSERVLELRVVLGRVLGRLVALARG
mmetsp:Transcript_11746/g.34604  ORF Transcript_11746/g.34604 Transcript_11746/m.34604 type:complete len:249 (-) Transcript_11746:464-1210(-)